jgi:hypothetical protein
MCRVVPILDRARQHVLEPAHAAVVGEPIALLQRIVAALAAAHGERVRDRWTHLRWGGAPMSLQLANGFEDAFVGVTEVQHHGIAVYDRARCIEILMTRDGMSPLEAEEFFDFNVAGAFVGLRPRSTSRR